MNIRHTQEGKSNFWATEGGELKQAKKGSAFKIKKIGGKYAFQTADGKFVGTLGEGKVSIVKSEDAALKIAMIEVTVTASPQTAADKGNAE